VNTKQYLNIELSPHCRVAHLTEDDVYFVVYEIGDDIYVEMSTNAPAAIPYYLFKVVNGNFEQVGYFGSPGC
jgi:hypothetical protein